MNHHVPSSSTPVPLIHPLLIPQLAPFLARVDNGGAGKLCIVVDDIADTAETLCQAADKLKAAGGSVASAAGLPDSMAVEPWPVVGFGCEESTHDRLNMAVMPGMSIGSWPLTMPKKPRLGNDKWLGKPRVTERLEWIYLSDV